MTSGPVIHPTPKYGDVIRTAVTRRFLAATVVTAAASLGLSFLLAAICGHPPRSAQVRLPAAFVFGTLLLISGSAWLAWAMRCVRRERQPEFRRALLAAMASAVLFVGVQSYGLWAFLQTIPVAESLTAPIGGRAAQITNGSAAERPPAASDALRPGSVGHDLLANPTTNAHSFVFLFATLHVLHFLVAQSVLLWVTLGAYMDRYDHEYFWGVTVAGWAWHALGIVWLAILAVFGIAGL